MKNPHHGATVTDFMAILESIDYSKFERFSNLAEERECEVLVVVPDQYNFKFSIKVAERKRRAEDSTHMQEIKVIGN